MPNQPKTFIVTRNSTSPARVGVTLVEILLVIVIMSVISALIIPQVRLINKDRNIRETARVVASMFHTASNRARIEGSAGIMLVKNQNFVKNDSLYAATAVYRMRDVDPYSGTAAKENFQLFDDPIDGWIAEIILPLQQGLVKAGDTMTVGNQGGQGFVGARIKSVTVYEDRLRLFLDISSTPSSTVDVGGMVVPLPPAGNAGNFQDDRTWSIDRKPRIVESSRVDLPAGYMVDMRYSDYVPNANQTYSRFLETNDSIVVIFDENGGVESVNDEFYQFPDKITRPFAPLYLFVAEEPIDGSDPLTKDNNLWVTINHVHGSVNVANHLAQPPNASFRQRLLDARAISSSTAQD